MKFIGFVSLCFIFSLLKVSNSQVSRNETESQNFNIRKYNLNPTNLTDEKLDIGAILPIIQQLINHTGIFSTQGTTTTTPVPTSAPTTAPAKCKCGTGAKPKVLNITSYRELDESEEYEDEDLPELKEILTEVRSTTHEGNNDTLTEFKANNHTRIVNGVASNLNGWPWMVGLILGFNANGTNTTNFQLFCGGTLISNSYVVTASHCFDKQFNFNTTLIMSQVSVLLGTNTLSSRVVPRVVSKISAVSIHPNYNGTTFANDITLLKLATPVNFTSKISPICLSQTGTPFDNRFVIAAGWGITFTNSTTPASYLREAGLKTITNKVCKPQIPIVIPSQICAVGSLPNSGSNVCRGDSGGPLMLFKPKTKTFTLIGITSYGPTACGTTSPDVFTRINSFTSFIKQVTNGTALCSNTFTP